MQVGMPADEFIDILWPQIESGGFYIVSFTAELIIRESVAKYR